MACERPPSENSGQLSPISSPGLRSIASRASSHGNDPNMELPLPWQVFPGEGIDMAKWAQIRSSLKVCMPK